jgi:hypothetical protein
MPSVFDNLSARLQQDEPSGLSPVDLADLPTEQKLIMLTLLRDSASGFEGVAADTLREKLREKAPNFDETVAQLVGLGWLIPLGEPANLRYRLNLRAKRGSATGFNLWSILTDRLPGDWKGTVKRDAS